MPEAVTVPGVSGGAGPQGPTAAALGDIRASCTAGQALGVKATQPEMATAQPCPSALRGSRDASMSLSLPQREALTEGASDLLSCSACIVTQRQWEPR